MTAKNGDHLDQGDVQLAKRAEPRFRGRAERPAGQRAEHEATDHALPEWNPQPGRDQLHRQSRGKEGMLAR